MKAFIKNFVREPDGAWRCISPATLHTKAGRVQVTPGTRLTRGTNFMGLDLAQWLDEQAAAGPEPTDV